jgi:hypothetical protein
MTQGRRSVAYSAKPAAPMFVCVGFIVWMAAGAMRFCGVQSRDPDPAQDIDSMRHRLKVIGVHAAVRSAKMVNLVSVLNWTFPDLKRDRVSHAGAAPVPNISVPAAIKSRGP